MHLPFPALRPAIAALLVTASGALSGCATASTVSLRLNGNIDDAMVTVDDQLLGTVAYVEKRGVAMPVGTHRISIEKPGYFPWDREVEAKDGAVALKLDVVLEKVPD